MSTSTTLEQPEQQATAQTERLRCPRCECTALPVAYTRHRRQHVARVRICRQCKRRLLTRERFIGVATAAH